MIATKVLRASIIMAASVLMATASFGYVQEKAVTAGASKTGESRGVLPLSTTISKSLRKKVIIRTLTSVRWENKEYGIDDGVDLLMSVITDPTTDGTTRATAINRLAHFSTSLQNRECLRKLCALYDGLESGMEKREILTLLTIAKDAVGLSLLHRVATTEPDPVIRIRAASGLAVWNIREGVRQLIELFPSRTETGLREVGGAAMITFTNLNERKEWNCPVEEIMKPATALSEQDYDRAIALAMRGFRDWFAANKDRFPDWKPGDPLPPNSPLVEEPSPEAMHASRVEANGWTCEASCDAPFGYMDCAACCLTHDACMTCFATSLAKATTPEFRKMYCNAAFKP